MSVKAPYLNVYRRADVVMTRGEGVYLYDTAENAYLDFASGIAVNALGHSHPHLVSALQEQAAQLWHCSNNYRNDKLDTYAQRLVDASALDKVFFCSSGAEAIDASIKFIRRYHHVNDTGRHRIITFKGGFHGRAISCISAGGNETAREGYHPLLEGFDQVEFNSIDAVKDVLCDKTAAILLEPVQGEGGVNAATPEFMRGLRELCDMHGLLLALDEVQCGFGRCGALFTHELYGITPDMIACAKGIGNGFPMAAVLVSNAIDDAMEQGCHGSTYGSNPLAMVVGRAVLDVMQEDGFFERVLRTGAALKAGLEGVAADFPQSIAEVRGTGLMLGLQMKIPARPISDALRDNGLLVAPAYGDVLRFMPPLIIDESHASEAMDKLRSSLRGVAP